MADGVVRGEGRESASLQYVEFRIRKGVTRYPKAPLEEEFAAWLRKRISQRYKQEPAEKTIENHINTLRSCIARRGIIGYLTSFESERIRRTTQRYYKEFLCEHFIHILLPLLQGEESRVENFGRGGREVLKNGEFCREKTFRAFR